MLSPELLMGRPHSAEDGLLIREGHLGLLTRLAVRAYTLVFSPRPSGGRTEMLSVLFCSRVKDNPDSNLPRLLDSAIAYTTPPERDHIEFLIKYDDDDEYRPPDAFFARYPFPIRTF